LSSGEANASAKGARHIVVATLYLDEINTREAACLERMGFDILAMEGLNIERDSDMVRVAPDFIVEFARSLDRPEADAIFVSCGALRTLDAVDEIERRAGKPVVASNQAMIWDVLRLAGIGDKIEGNGQLPSDN
jgi:maleate isomerase